MADSETRRNSITHRPDSLQVQHPAELHTWRKRSFSNCTSMNPDGLLCEFERPRHRPFLIGVSGGTASGKVRDTTCMMETDAYCWLWRFNACKLIHVVVTVNMSLFFALHILCIAFAFRWCMKRTRKQHEEVIIGNEMYFFHKQINYSNDKRPLS